MRFSGVIGTDEEPKVAYLPVNHAEKNSDRPTGLAKRIARLFSLGTKSPAAVPEGVRVYAVGDIHGCLRELDRLTAAILHDSASWPGTCHLVYVGDYIDRGPDSKGVVERLLTRQEGFTLHYLRGNHDQVLLDFLDDPSVYRSWRDFGGRETLLSYGVVPPQFDDLSAMEKAAERFRTALPSAHLAFFENLQLSAKIGDYFFVHAGVRSGIALDDQSAEDLLWIRDEFLASSSDYGMVIVHGHSPTPEPVRRPNRIGIDTGAYATRRLTAVVLEGDKCRFLCS